MHVQKSIDKSELDASFNGFRNELVKSVYKAPLMLELIEMLKFIVFVLTVILGFLVVCGATDIVSLYLDNVDTSVTRVKTLGERQRRWQEFAVLDFIGIVEQYGYSADEHTVQTTDGYLLKLHRVNGSPISPQAYGKPVVFLAPGLATSSDFYVMFGPQQSLVLQLADAGYDVWIGNFRGTTYSRHHTEYSTLSSSYEFWNYNLDHLALIDLPAFIDAVLQVTNQRKLTYIGYSMGTTTCFILLSTKPEYNDVMNVVISIAPEVFFTPPFSPVTTVFMKAVPLMTNFLHSRNIYDLVPMSRFNLIMGREICRQGSGKRFCQFLFNKISNKNITDSETFETIFNHFPAGTSFNIIRHYYQLALSGELTHYDYGPALNTGLYYTLSPPQCDLGKVTSPQAIFYSEKDVLGSERDVMTLRNRLKNVIYIEKVPKNFNHLDFFWNQNATNTVFNHVIAIVKNFS